MLISPAGSSVISSVSLFGPYSWIDGLYVYSVHLEKYLRITVGRFSRQRLLFAGLSQERS